jgi:phosphoribosylformimino-5-aminoimidazole carboxamide ribotide isomerase
MLIIPAIDLREGRVVRLAQGAFDQQTTYTDSPADVMKRWQSQGATLVHVVDLDGAKDGEPKNWAALKNVLDVATVPVEFGGGLRNIETVGAILEGGVKRVIIGTKAFDRELLTQLISKYGERIVIGLDIKDGTIRTHGWLSEGGGESLDAFLKALEALGVKTVIATDISRDGMLQGPNMDLLHQLLKATKMNVILSGGVSSIDDLDVLSKIKNKQFVGVIVGKALYEERFRLADAIEKYQIA